MGQPVVHFEIIGADADATRGYYAELFEWEVPDVEGALAKAEHLGGNRVMGPETVQEGVEIGLFNDPEGHLVGVVKGG